MPRNRQSCPGVRGDVPGDPCDKAKAGGPQVRFPVNARQAADSTATPATGLTPRSPAGITIRQAVSEADLAEAAAVQHHAYQLPRPLGPHDIARLTRLTRRGGLVAIAIDESSGTVTGTGLIDVAGDRSVGELAAVGVLAAFRRRGIASALSAQLARTAHSQGISLVFLEAEPEEEQIYRRTGFTDATTKIWASIR
jgi:GNAT superfamily N-acetyltransferase